MQYAPRSIAISAVTFCRCVNSTSAVHYATAINRKTLDNVSFLGKEPTTHRSPVLHAADDDAHCSWHILYPGIHKENMVWHRSTQVSV